MDLGASIRPLWGLDPDVAFLNHGSFGACPTSVLDEQSRYRAILERQPVDFFVRTSHEMLYEARRTVARFLRVHGAGLVFVPNATTGTATVLHSLDIGPGDRVVVTDHTYGAVLNALRHRGCTLVVVPLELDDPDPAATLLEAVTAETRLVVIDAITSSTGWALPWVEVVKGCRERGVLCHVDAAHAPGQVDEDLQALDPDFWVGNLHKWAYSPKGAAVMVVREELRERMRPPVVSHFDGWPMAFDWPGTIDPTAYLAAPAALELFDWDQARAHGRQVVRAGAELVRDRIGALLPLRDSGCQMSLLDVGLPDLPAADALRERLRTAGVEVASTTWRGRGYLRISGAVYNDEDDYVRLAEALAAVS
ncbi:MAG: selenocysteine lyase / isopenicillin epimerase [Frankiales bacterium]|nr:selenocysteine lyase / isopenicillin epimerase [Frankiales bacterium]